MTASRRRLLPPSNTSREKSKLLGLIRNNLLKHMARLTSLMHLLLSCLEILDANCFCLYLIKQLVLAPAALFWPPRMGAPMLGLRASPTRAGLRV
jgi:hypothetical protein